MVTNRFCYHMTGLRSLIKSTHRVICNVYLALLTLFSSTTAEGSIMENLCSVRIYTSPEPSINFPWITNKECSMESCGWRNWSSLIRAYTSWSLTSTWVWPGFKTAVHFIFIWIKQTWILKVLTLSRNNGRINSTDTWWSFHETRYTFCLNTEKRFLVEVSF